MPLSSVKGCTSASQGMVAQDKAIGTEKRAAPSLSDVAADRSSTTVAQAALQLRVQENDAVQ